MTAALSVAVAVEVKSAAVSRRCQLLSMGSAQDALHPIPNAKAKEAPPESYLI